MLRFKYLVASGVLTVAVSFAMNVGWSTKSFAAQFYTFTFTGNAASNPGWDANGSFSIPIADFIGDPASLPNTDITAASFTIVTPPGDTWIMGLADVNSLGSNSFVYGPQPLLQNGTGNFLIDLPAGCNPFQTNCGAGIEAAFAGTGVEIFGPTGLTDLGGLWTTSLTSTPLPAALPLFAGGLGVMGLLGWRRKRKNAAAVATA